MNSEIDVHIIIVYFNEIYGPQSLTIYPEISINKKERMIKTIIKLIDIHTDVEEWQFIYVDPMFSSLNIKFTHNNSNVRGGLRDYIISLAITPTTLNNDELWIKLSRIWNYIPTIKDICSNYLFEEEKEPEIGNELSKEMKDIVDEIKKQMNS